MKLYPFQEAILTKMETEKHVAIQTGCGKAMILLEYAKRHPDAKIIISVSPSLMTQYAMLMDDMQVTNVILVT
jgi:tRNA G46 methylase TrmB